MAQTTPARPGAVEPPSSGSSRAGSLLGQWDSAVTSYYVLTGATALLIVLGLVMVLSSSSVESLAANESPYAVFVTQAQFALIGVPVMLVASRLPQRFYTRIAWPALAVAAVLQLLTLTPLGLSAGGNRGWIGIGSFTMQPAEVVKLALAAWLGAVLARKRALLGEWRHALVPAVPVSALMVGLVMLGHDLGTALVLIVLVAGALFIAGIPLRVFGFAGAIAAVGVAALTIPSANRRKRIFSWLSDECDITNECYQSEHGIRALATGGWGGVGLGGSAEKWSYLPEAHNDFIFAIIGEELGLIGTLLVLGLFTLLALAMFRIIRRHPDPFVKITTGAVACWVIGQALVNVGVVIGLVPIIGVPLPLVSAGGSALIVTMTALGMVISFARAEPGAAEALAARPHVVRRSLAVLGRIRA